MNDRTSQATSRPASRPASPRRHPSTVLLGAAVLLGLVPVLLGPPAVLAQEKAGESTFEETTDVIQVQVPINVVSKDGEPVTDLQASDFEVFDEGEKREIVGFETIDLTELDAEEADERLAELPRVARRNFLLLFDFSFSTASSIIKARQAAHDFVLEALHPSDLVAIATYSHEFGLRLVMTFTPDRAQLVRAIDTLGLSRRPGAATQLRDPLRFIVEPPRRSTSIQADAGSTPRDVREQVEAAALESSRVIASQFERSQEAYERSLITAWSNTMGDIAKALNAVAGRKHVIYFSEGFNSELLFGRRPVSQGTGFDQRMQDRLEGNLWMVSGDQTHGNTFLQGDIADMLEEFRRADGIIQAVDIAGLRADFSGDAVNARGRGSDGLFYMARETGGELFEATNDLTDQLERVLRRSAVTYILTFQPEDLAMDGKYHRLKVKVDGHKGGRVSHRAGYYAPQPFEGLNTLEKSLLASDAIASAEPRQDIAMNVLVAPFRASETMAYVPVIIEARGDTLLLDHRGDSLPVEVYAYASNMQGEMRDYFSQRAQLSLAQWGPKVEEAGFKYYGSLSLEPGEYLIRVLVRNSETGRTGVVALSLEVPELGDETETTLLPPFFQDEPMDKWFLLRYRAGQASDSVPYPFIVDGIPFVPSAKPVLQPDEATELYLMAYNLGPDEPSLEAWIKGSDGERSPAEGFRLVERTITGIAGYDKLLARFRPKGLERGDYTLEIELVGADGGARETSEIPFRVRH